MRARPPNQPARLPVPTPHPHPLFVLAAEPHILLFRRPLGTDPNTGKVNAVLRQQAIDAYNKEFGKA